MSSIAYLLISAASPVPPVRPVTLAGADRDAYGKVRSSRRRAHMRGGMRYRIFSPWTEP
jgi:hypothetical protein